MAGSVFSGATVVRGASWNLAAQAVPAVLGLVLTPLLIHHLGLPRYGLLALAWAITTFLSSFDGGIRPTAGRYFAVYVGSGDDRAATQFLVTFLLVLFGAGLVWSSIIFLLSPEAMSVFSVPHPLRSEGTFLFRTVGVLATAAFVHSIFVAVLNARHRYALAAATNIATYLLWAGGIVYVLNSGSGLRALGVLFVAQQVLASALIVPAALRYFRWADVGLMPWREFRAVVAYSAKVQTSSISSLVNSQFDTFIIGALLPIRSVAIYNGGFNLAFQTRNVVNNALVPIANQMSKTFGAGGERAAFVEFCRMQRVWVKLTTGWFFAVAGVAYFSIVAWLGPQFRLGGLVATILLLGYMMNLYTGMLTIYLSSTGRPGLETRYGVVSMLVNVVFTIALSVFGLIGIVAGTAIGTLVGSLYFVGLVKRRVSRDTPSFLGEIPAVAGLAAGGVSFGLSAWVHTIAPTGFFGLLTVGSCALAGLAVYAVVLFGPSGAVRLVRHPRAVAALVDSHAEG